MKLKNLDPNIICKPLTSIYRMWGRTLRYTTSDNWESIRDMAEQNTHQFVFCLWHNELFSLPWFGVTRSRIRLFSVVSQSKDAEFLAQTLENLGVLAARGSSRRGGLQAIIQAKKFMQKDDRHCVFTVDGPKGPRHQAKEGAVYLASKTNAWLCPVRLRPSSAFVFSKAWDKFEMAKPFSHVHITFGDMWQVPQKMDEETLERERLKLENSLESLLKLLGRTSVPVLCYHNIGGNGVPRGLFEQQMQALSRAGIKTLGHTELQAVLHDGPLNDPCVVLTFDDGFRDLYTYVAPILEKYCFKAIVFCINNRMRPEEEPGNPGEIIADKAHEAFVTQGKRADWLSWNELHELVEEGLLEVGSHSMSHLKAPVSKPSLLQAPDHWAYASMRTQKGPYPAMAPELGQPIFLQEKGRLETESEYYDRIFKNLQKSRDELESNLRVPIHSLAWPWGVWSDTAVQAAQDSGFTMAFTLERGPIGHNSDAMHLPRLEVRTSKKLNWFSNRLFLYSRTATANAYSRMRL